MRMILLVTVMLLGASVASAAPTPGSRLSMATLLDVSRLHTNRQVLVLPGSASSSLRTLELRITRPATTLLKGERRCTKRTR